jgi:hypothetical protein
VNNGFIELVDFEYCFIEAPIVDGTTIIIPFRKLLLDGELLPRCNLIFEDVFRSERRIAEYTDDGQSFKPEGKRVIHDVPTRDVAVSGINHYGLEGVFESSEGWRGWCGWDVDAVSYHVERL